jgi:hypothetical protein
MITSSGEQACDRQAAWEMFARHHIWALTLINRLDNRLDAGKCAAQLA